MVLPLLLPLVLIDDPARRAVAGGSGPTAAGIRAGPPGTSARQLLLHAM
jgi:hypothetical protein